MPVEDHPLFHEWKRALENLIEAKEALRENRGTPEDLAKAKTAYIKLADQF